MASDCQFFLKTVPHHSQPDSPYANLYLRHHGSGINAVVLTLTPPKFIKAHLEDDKHISFTSASHPGRTWGLSLNVEGKQCAGWESVHIVEDGGSGGFVFREGADGKEYLSCEDTEGQQQIWTDWMVCEWATGHPQLFWVTEKLRGEMQPFCHRVRIVREML